MDSGPNIVKFHQTVSLTDIAGMLRMQADQIESDAYGDVKTGLFLLECFVDGPMKIFSWGEGGGAVRDIGLLQIAVMSLCETALINGSDPVRK
jgi:hypothetical protein